MKKIRRGYRLNPTVDLVIKLMAHASGESEADALSYCVLVQAADIIKRRSLLRRLAQAEPLPKELADALRKARKESLRKWCGEHWHRTKDKPAQHL